MHLHEATEVIEAHSQEGANEKLRSGWTLLAVVPGGGAHDRAHVKYVLGRKEQRESPPRSPKQDAALARADEELKDIK